jgi:hypothetical protein
MRMILNCQLEREIAWISIIKLRRLVYYPNVYFGLIAVFLLIFK